jgi:hypothetical protein
MWPTAAHLCGTRLEGGHRSLSRTLRFVLVEPMRAATSAAGTRARGNAGTSPRRHAVTPDEGTGARKVLGNRVAATASASPWCSGIGPEATSPPRNGSPSTQPYRRERPWCPPSRRVPHKWSGRRPIGTRAAIAAFPSRTRRTCLSSEGGHQGLPARRPSVESDGEAEPPPRSRRRAICEVRDARYERIRTKKRGRIAPAPLVSFAIRRTAGSACRRPACIP